MSEIIDEIQRFDVPLVAEVQDRLKVDINIAQAIVIALKWCRDGDITHEQAIVMCDTLLDTCGVEALEIEGADEYSDGGIRVCPPFSFCNTGDSYATTLARDHEHGKWIFACWADLAEEYEKAHKLGDWEEFEEEPEQCPDCHGGQFTLEFFPESSRWEDKGSYSWVCRSCGHHCYAVEDFAPEEEADEEPPEDD